MPLFDHALRSITSWPFLIGAIYFALERLFPLRKKEFFRKEFFQDWLWWFYLDGVALVGQFFARFFERYSLYFVMFSPLSGEDSLLGIARAYFGINKIVFEYSLVRIIVVILMKDVIYYFYHLALHRFEILWNFHKLHHSSADVDVLSGHKNDYLESFLGGFIGAIPFVFVHLTQIEWLAVVLFVENATYLVHANIRYDLGFLNNVLMTNKQHRWHHSKELVHRWGQNFGAYFVFWDKLFGTYYCPKKHAEDLGIYDLKYPSTFLGRLVYPFQRLFW